jgi:hypothetical protein
MKLLRGKPSNVSTITLLFDERRGRTGAVLVDRGTGRTVKSGEWKERVPKSSACGAVSVYHLTGGGRSTPKLSESNMLSLFFSFRYE